jgi:hypothetical protein
LLDVGYFHGYQVVHQQQQCLLWGTSIPFRLGSLEMHLTNSDVQKDFFAGYNHKSDLEQVMKNQQRLLAPYPHCDRLEEPIARPESDHVQ